MIAVGVDQHKRFSIRPILAIAAFRTRGFIALTRQICGENSGKGGGSATVAAGAKASQRAHEGLSAV